MTLDMYNYTPQATHHATFDFDPTTWVVWANRQLATVLVLFILFFIVLFGWQNFENFVNS